jgi:hypothetical protein
VNVPVISEPKQTILFSAPSFRAAETIFIGIRTKDSFQVCNLSSCNLLADTNKFCQGSVLLSRLFSDPQKPSSSGLEPRTVFGVMVFVPAISSPKQLCSWRRSSIVLSFRATETALTENRTEVTFCGVVTFLCSVPSLKE